MLDKIEWCKKRWSIVCRFYILFTYFSCSSHIQGL